MAELFCIKSAVLVQKMGKVRIFVQSLYRGVSDQSQLGREVEGDALLKPFGRRIACLHSTGADFALLL